MYADGGEEEADAIVTATGYDLSLPFLPEDVRRTLNADATGLDLYVHTFHPDLPGLAFIGQYILIGPYAPCVELQARWIAMVWSGVRELPPRDRMERGIEAWRNMRQVTPNLLLPPLAVALSQEAGVAPDLAARPEITVTCCLARWRRRSSGWTATGGVQMRWSCTSRRSPPSAATPRRCQQQRSSRSCECWSAPLAIALPSWERRSKPSIDSRPSLRRSLGLMSREEVEIAV